MLGGHIMLRKILTIVAVIGCTWLMYAAWSIAATNGNDIVMLIGYAMFCLFCLLDIASIYMALWAWFPRAMRIIAKKLGFDDPY